MTDTSYSVYDVHFMAVNDFIPSSLWKYDEGKSKPNPVIRAHVLVDQLEVLLGFTVTLIIGTALFALGFEYMPSHSIFPGLIKIIFGFGTIACPMAFLYCVIQLIRNGIERFFFKRPCRYGHDLFKVIQVLQRKPGELVALDAQNKLDGHVRRIVRDLLHSLDVADENEASNPCDRNRLNALEAKKNLRESFDLLKRFGLTDKRGWKAYREPPSAMKLT